MGATEALASSPNKEEKKPASACKGIKSVPTNRENARIKVYILDKVLMIVPSVPDFSHFLPLSTIKRYCHRIAQNRSKVNLSQKGWGKLISNKKCIIWVLKNLTRGN